MAFQQFFKKISASKWFRLALLIFLLSTLIRSALSHNVLSFQWVFQCEFFSRGIADMKNISFNPDNVRSGSFLLAGVFNHIIVSNMPLYDAVAALALNLGISPYNFLLVLCFAIAILVFSAACLLRGYRAGIVSLAALFLLWLIGDWDMEQMLYSFFLMLSLALLILKQRENTMKNSLLAGLAIGASLLIRSPLFLFPPLVVLCEWFFSKECRRDFVLRSLVFLAASYALLVPWAVVRYPITGKFSLFDSQRAACNLISSGRGSVYTMDGDFRKLAGPGYDENAKAFFLKEVGKAPFFYVVTVLRRLWHIFFFNAWVYGLLLAALFAARGREQRLDFLLPVYFVIIHALFSIETRYFQPMTCLVAPLAIAALFPRRFAGDAGPGLFSVKAPLVLFWLSFCVVIALQGLVVAYPFRAGNAFSRGSLTRALERFPNDRVVQGMRCDELLEAGNHAEYYACLEGYSRKFGDKAKGYLLQVLASSRPAELELPHEFKLQGLILRMLREFELGDNGAAMFSFNRLYAMNKKEHNMLREVPYARDREIAQILGEDSTQILDRNVYENLLLWPPGRIVKILSGVEKCLGLTSNLKLLKYVAGNHCKSGGIARCMSRRDETFSALARETLRSHSSGLTLLPAKAGRGRPAAALYFKALLNPSSSSGSDGILFGRGVSEAELFKMLDLRAAGTPGPALENIGGALLIRKRPLYYTLRALFSLGNGNGALLNESLDSLELALASGNDSGAGQLDGPAGDNSHSPAWKSETNAQGKACELSDRAVGKMRENDFKAAEGLLLEALGLDNQNPEAFMNLCSIWIVQNEKEKALGACRSAVSAVNLYPKNRTPGFEMLASEASFASYKLLEALGRRAEAREALLQAVSGAPASWPGLAGARKLLADKNLE